MTIKKTLTIISAAAVLCGGVFVGGAAAFFDMDDDPWAYPEESQAPSDPAPSTGGSGGWNFDDTPAPAPASAAPAPQAAKPAPRAAKPAPAPRAPKPPKEPRAAASSGEGTLNLFGSLGWGFGIGGYYLGEETEFTNNALTSAKDKYLNLGRGLKFELGAGYSASPGIEARFSADITYGVFGVKTDTLINNNKGEVENNPHYNISFKAMIVPQFEMLELFDVYVGAGLILGFAGSSYDSTAIRGDIREKSEFQRQFSPGFGFCGVIGLTLPFNDAITFFGEVQFESVSYRQTKRRVIDYASDSSPTEVTFEKNSTDRLPPPLIPATNWSLRVGMKWWVM